MLVSRKPLSRRSLPLMTPVLRKRSASCLMRLIFALMCFGIGGLWCAVANTVKHCARIVLSVGSMCICSDLVSSSIFALRIPVTTRDIKRRRRVGATA